MNKQQQLTNALHFFRMEVVGAVEEMTLNRFRLPLSYTQEVKLHVAHLYAARIERWRNLEFCTLFLQEIFHDDVTRDAVIALLMASPRMGKPIIFPELIDAFCDIYDVKLLNHAAA